MAFSSIFQFTKNDQIGQGTWLVAHYLEHQQFYLALMTQTPAVITTNYPIQRMEDKKDWLAAHQEMSQSVWTALGGGQSQDFGSLNWESDSERSDWFNFHQLWHKTVRDSLGL